MLEHKLKIDFYKKRILKELSDKKNLPNCEKNDLTQIIEYYIDQINLNESIFKAYKINDKYFNVDKYNQSLFLIYNDLLILYELLYNLTNIKFINIKNNIESKILFLKNETQKTNELIKAEINSSCLGKTLLYKNKDFDIYKDKILTKIDLGTVKISKGKRIACIANIRKINKDDITFIISNKNEKYICAAYNNNHSKIQIGYPTTKKYSLNIDNDILINNNIPIQCKGLKPNMSNIYNIYAEKNKMYKVINNSTINNKQLLTAPAEITDEFDFSIHFVTKNCSKIKINYNKKPLTINNSDPNNFIKNGEIIIPNNQQEIEFNIECEKDTVIYIEPFDGNIYAEKNIGFINNNILYYPFNTFTKQFDIEELIYSNKNTYGIELISKTEIKKEDIENILIKELY